MDEITRDSLGQYVRDLFAVEDAHLQLIRDEMMREGLPTIEVRPEEGRMLQFLLTAVGARSVLEIGTLAGYSGTWMARALPEDGRLITLEGDPDRAQLARDLFARAGLGDRVEVHEGRALTLLSGLETEGPFDAIFIDANKDSYPEYLIWAKANVRVGGLIMAHNAFSRGRVVDPQQQNDRNVRGIVEFNRQMAGDPALLGTIIPIGDGIAAAVRIQ